MKKIEKIKYVLLTLLAMLFLLGLPCKHSFAADNKYPLVLDIDQECVDYVLLNGIKYNKTTILYVEEGTNVIIECHSKEYYDAQLIFPSQYFHNVPTSKYGNRGYSFVMPAKHLTIECYNWSDNPPGKVVLKATVNGKEQIIKEGDEIPEGTKVTAYFVSPNKIDTKKISYTWTDYNDSDTQSIIVSYNDVHYIFKRERCCKIKVEGYSNDTKPYVSPSFLSVSKETYNVNFVLTNGGKIKLEGRYNDTISSYTKDGSEPTTSYTVTKKYPYGGMVYFRLDEDYPADITVTSNNYSRTVYTDSADPNLYYFYMTDEDGDTVTINFNDFDYNLDTIKIENTNIEYTGQLQAIHPLVKNTAGRVFKEYVDYVIGNDQGRDIKSYIAYICFNTHSSKFKKYFIFNIVPNTSGKGTVVGNYTYNGQVIKPTIKVTSDISSTDLIEGTDYTVSYPKSVNAGKYEATITFKGNYGGTKKVAYNINPCKDASAKLKSDTLTYSGKSLKPTVIVSDSKGLSLKSGKDYTITYPSTSKVIGAYKVKVTFKGNYTGSKTLTYNIVPKGTTISKLAAASKGFSVSWKKQASETTGYEIRYSLKEDMSSSTSKTVKDNSTTSLKVTGLKSGKYYYVQVRTYKTIKGKNYASDWSKVQKIKTK